MPWTCEKYYLKFLVVEDKLSHVPRQCEVNYLTFPCHVSMVIPYVGWLWKVNYPGFPCHVEERFNLPDCTAVKETTGFICLPQSQNFLLNL
jgi:hypothetical protein